MYMNVDYALKAPTVGIKFILFYSILSGIEMEPGLTQSLKATKL